MPKCLLTICLLLWLSTYSGTLLAQTLTVGVTDAEGQPIELSYLRLYATDSSEKLLEYRIVRRGMTTFRPSFIQKQVRVLITSAGYQSLAERRVIRSETEGDTLLFRLQKFDFRHLDTVIVAQKRPVVISNDTTTYRLEAFGDGTERRLEDILKKLPGIDVNEKTGEVRFKGRPIETILLEGDNLLGANYTLATKNLSTHTVREVQAIENYSDNYVLKGLEREERVVLNLKLNPQKMNVSGFAEAGAGYRWPKSGQLDANANFIGLQPRHKFFSVFSYNNSGSNRSPIDYFGNNRSLEQTKDQRYRSEKFITDPSLVSFLDDSRSNFNSQLFGNYNGLYNLGRKTSIKLNIYRLQDKLSNEQSFDNLYFVNADTVQYQDMVSNAKRPSTLKADVYLRNNVSEKALLECTSSFSNEMVRSAKSVVSNFIPAYQTDLLTGDLFIKNSVQYTQRVAPKHAVQISLFNTYSGIGQDFNLSPSIFQKGPFASDLQVSNMRKTYISLQATLFGANRYGTYNFTVRRLVEASAYASGLSNDLLPNFSPTNQNDTRYQKNAWVHTATVGYRRGRWKLSSSYAATFLSQSLLNKSEKQAVNKQDFIFEPNARAVFVLSDLSSLNVSCSYARRPQVEPYVFTNSVVESYRSVVQNLPSLNLLNTLVTGAGYSYHDLFNQFSGNFGVSYQRNQGDYLTAYVITDTITYAKNLFRDLRTDGVDLYGTTSKYIPALRSTLKVSATCAINEYYNFLNFPDLRSNRGRYVSLELFYKSVFERALNFESTFTHNTSAFKNSDTDGRAVSGIQSSTKLILKASKQVKAHWVFDYFRQNLRLPFDNLFLDFHMSFTAKKSAVECRFIARNLLNNQQFNVFQVTDFSRSQFSTNILPRSFLLYTTFKI